jgi:SAM-dependent methyltransferase
MTKEGSPISGLGGVFGFPGVAKAYPHRPPYPADVFAILDGLITDEPRVVLDLGAGEGALARPLAPRVDRVDAVDVSEAMIAVGRDQPGGRHPNLRWIHGAAETAGLEGPYALVTAGASLHWLDWEPLMARLRPELTANAMLAAVDHDVDDVPWHGKLIEIIRRHSRSPGFNPAYSAIEEMGRQGYLAIAGREETAPVSFEQDVKSYVEQFHSRASLAREHMTPEEVQAFDEAVIRLVEPWAAGGVLSMKVIARVTWGRPL